MTLQLISPTTELFLARIMSLRAHTTHDNKPSNLMAAQWNRARVMNARGRDENRPKEKYAFFTNT